MAIFIVLLSVSFVSAVDTTDVAIADDAADDESVENTTGDDDAADDDAADDEATDEDQDDEEDLDVGDNPYRHGELTANEKAALADSPDDAGNAAGSTDNAKTTNVNTNATGNPLLVLVVALAALGIYPLSRRK